MGLSEAEKIRKAESIYYRRRYNQNNRSAIEKPKNRILPWIVGKTFYVLIIVVCVVGYNNKEYILSENFKEDVNKFINQEIKIEDIINTIRNNEYENGTHNNSVYEVNNGDNIEEVELKEKDTSNIKPLKKTSSYKKDKSIEEIIKDKVKFGSVLKRNLGVTSRYGYRKSKNKKVQGYHTGIDIAAVKGENIYSSISGKVIEVSSNGNYGKHLKIRSKSDSNVVTLYAHCSKIVVKEGKNVKIGDKIAEVGSTGNSTGPHLHYEIRYNNKSLNPEKIMGF